MSVSDSDIELLEASLDGALAAEESRSLDARLSREPELAATLEALRSERSLRRSMFAGLEPDDQTAAAFADRLCAAAFHPPRISVPAGPWRWVSAVAACLLIGFLTGWAGNAHLFPGQRIASPQANSGGTSTVRQVVTYQVSVTDESGHVAIQTFDSLEKAQQFAREARTWQEQREQLHNGAAPVTVAQF